MRLRTRPILILVVVAGALLALAFVWRRRGSESPLTTAVVDRADILDVVGATGTLEAVVTVQVGSQVSGTIESLYADFNSQVKKGQVITRLDPSLFNAHLGQAKANLISARANVERARAEAADAQQKYTRAKELAAQNLLPESDLDTAKATFDGAVAQLKSNEAAVSQADANVNQAQVDLDHTVISTPIDGVVVARNVDVGQTVAASFTAPVLFIIANDLTKMRVNASIDEADVGRIENGQEVSFRVDAYPDRTFPGRIEQIRLQPTTVQNVVTYSTLITVDNDDMKLRPGMTATVSVIVRKAENALRIPAAALRYRPEGFEPPGGRRPAAASAEGGAAGAPSASGAAPAAASGGALARPGPGPAAGGPASRHREASAAADGSRPAGAGDGGARGRHATVFALDEAGNPKPTPVVLGISDGQFVEVKEGLAEGARVVLGLGGERGPRTGASPAASNPFSPQFQQRRR